MALTLRGNGQILSDNYVIDSDGTMGMGTTNPQHALHIKGSFPYIALEDTDNGATHYSTITGNSDGNIYYDANFNNVGGVNGGHIFRNNGATVSPMRIHSDGYVTTPNQPAFRATSGASSIGANTYVVFTSTDFDRTNSYNTSTGAYTAPVSGVYLFYVTALYNYSGSTPTWKVNWYKNGAFDAVVSEIQTSQTNWNTQFNSTVTMNLSDGDYVQIRNDQSNVHISGTQTKFGGYLIG